MTPTGEWALGWIRRYLDELWTSLVIAPDEGFLFLTTLGEGFTANRMTRLVRNYVKGADLGKTLRDGASSTTSSRYSPHGGHAVRGVLWLGANATA